MQVSLQTADRWLKTLRILPGHRIVKIGKVSWHELKGTAEQAVLMPNREDARDAVMANHKRLRQADPLRGRALADPAEVHDRLDPVDVSGARVLPGGP